MDASTNSTEYRFTSESVSMGHPDKVCDQVSDAILDSLIGPDKDARAAIETLVTTDLVVIVGEVTVHNAEAKQALKRTEQTARDTIRGIGYTDASIGFDCGSCEVMTRLHEQSPDISQGVTEGEGLHKEQGAGDQGLMFGFACNETRTLMPLPIDLSHRLMEHLAELRESGEIGWLRPDAKAQVTVVYRRLEPVRIDNIVLSTQHTEQVIDRGTDFMSDLAKRELIDKAIKPAVQRCCPHLWSGNIAFHINPTGKFVTGGPDGDSGLTGRKIIVDTYGGRGRHGGGAFSGKDPSKVDRSACYMARHIAKNIVAAELATAAEVQVAYAIGVAEPVSLLVNCHGTGTVGEQRLEHAVRDIFPLTPRGIIDYLDLRRPIYRETARHGHFGRELPQFTWEQTNKVEELKSVASKVAT